ncbi:hypothetical protein BLNAU_8473 [Blattamonas nauphoetae]|uniref:Uncharacterized protein n=1 Tax=Blattamonas nauphoetae TaxID=2049346 RepID=A0ABQ9XYR4_9EUKA|nr:hypothetical protein BLNAU_8473 [Blattamonas nauphoetae]
MEMEGVLSSGVVERLCTRIETESSADVLLPTLLVLDRLCSGLQSHHGIEQLLESKEDQFSLTRRCGFTLARIEKAVLMLEKAVGGKLDCDEKTRNIQQQVGGMIVRHFRSSIHMSTKEIGAIGIDLAAVRREMEVDREKEKREMEMRENEREMAAKKAEEERQRAFSVKMREMDEMKRMNEKWIEEGRQREEEKKREEERKRMEEEERRRNVKEGAAAIEVFQQDNFILSGNLFTRTADGWKALLSAIFGTVVVRISFVIRSVGDSYLFPGLITSDLIEQTKTYTGGVLGNLKGGAGWVLHPYYRSVYHDGKISQWISMQGSGSWTARGDGGRWTRRKANIETVTRWRDTASLHHEHSCSLPIRHTNAFNKAIS